MLAAELTRATPRGLRCVRTGDAYQPPALCTYRTRRAACPQGATYCTYWVRVPASAVPYVPRTVATQVVDWVIARITGQIFTEQVALAKRMRAEPGRSEHVRAVEADPSFYEGWLAPRLARAALRAEG